MNIKGCVIVLLCRLRPVQVWYFDEQRYRRDCNQQTMKFTVGSSRSRFFFALGYK
jgi:hypothetical protein